MNFREKMVYVSPEKQRRNSQVQQELRRLRKEESMKIPKITLTGDELSLIEMLHKK